MDKISFNFFIFAYWHDPRWEKFVGATVKIWDLAYNLALDGHHVVLFLPKYHFNAKTLPFKLIEIPLIDFPFLRMLSFNIFLSFYLIKYIFNQKVDFFYVRRMNSIVPLIFSKLKKAYLFYEINDDPYNRQQIREGTKIKFNLRSFLSSMQDEINLWICDRAFIISQAVMDKIAIYNPSLSLQKLKIMPSGSNIDLLKPLDKDQCRIKLKLKKDSKIVGFAGSLLEHQGIDTLIAAAPNIIESIPETIFIIIGEGPKKKDWIDATIQIGVNRHFYFPGQIPYEKIPIWLGAADICLSPYLRSAGLRSPVKIFDYMACEKAVIASKLNGTTDLFEDSGAISFVEPENHEELARMILELLNDVNKTKSMGEKGRQFIKDRFDRKYFAKQISDEAEKVIN